MYHTFDCRTRRLDNRSFSSCCLDNLVSKSALDFCREAFSAVNLVSSSLSIPKRDLISRNKKTENVILLFNRQRLFKVSVLFNR